MKTTRIPSLMAAVLLFALTGALAATTAQAQRDNAFPSWKDGKVKQSVLEFVAKVTKKGSPDFVPVAERTLGESRVIAQVMAEHPGRLAGCGFYPSHFS